jgi:hypothetical protein
VKRFLAPVAALAVLAALPASAKVTFYQYDGPEIVKQGEGGTKVVKHGIEYWAQGRPSKPHKLLGTIVDSRDASDGSAIGSKSVAKKVKEVGGDAVVVMNQDITGAGVYQGGGPGYAFAVPLQNATTSLAVIKYVTSQ